MSNQSASPATAAEQSEVTFGEEMTAELVGATIVAFGGSDEGEVFISVAKNGKTTDLIIGKDERGDIALFEIAGKAAPAVSPLDYPEDYVCNETISHNTCVSCSGKFYGFLRRVTCKVCSAAWAKNGRAT